MYVIGFFLFRQDWLIHSSCCITAIFTSFIFSLWSIHFHLFTFSFYISLRIIQSFTIDNKMSTSDSRASIRSNKRASSSTDLVDYRIVGNAKDGPCIGRCCKGFKKITCYHFGSQQHTPALLFTLCWLIQSSILLILRVQIPLPLLSSAIWLGFFLYIPYFWVLGSRPRIIFSPTRVFFTYSAARLVLHVSSWISFRRPALLLRAALSRLLPVPVRMRVCLRLACEARKGGLFRNDLRGWTLALY